MRYSEAYAIALRILKELKPHCERIEIAGSIRRKKTFVKDIEIVAIPKPYEVGLFQSGIANVVSKWEKVKGELPCKYTQRILPDGIKLDLFFAEPGNWGYIFAIRTGSAEFSRNVLALGWKLKGYRGEKGWLIKDKSTHAIPEEEDLFELIGIDFMQPEKREVK